MRLVTQRGLSLFEIVLAVALFGLIAATLTTLALSGQQALDVAEREAAARRLAWSGLEATRAVAARAWNELTPNASDPLLLGTDWALGGEGASSVERGFTRQIEFAPICRAGDGQLASCPAASTDVHARMATARVRWPSATGVERQIELSTLLSNWDSLDWETTDWSGGPGQGVWSDPSRYFSDDGNLESTPDGLRLRSNTITTDSPNRGFDSALGWSFTPWNNDPGEVIPTGVWQGSGGNPGGHVRVTIPFNARDNQLGGYWQRPIFVPADGLAITCSTDWRVFTWSAGTRRADDFRLLLFLDSTPGAPILGTEVLSSNQLRASSSWLSPSPVDCSNRALTAGVYYLKAAAWLDAASSPTGPIVVGFDNTGLRWEITEFATEGELVSSAFSLGDPSPVQVVEWEADTDCSPACGVKINVRTAPASGNRPGVWGPWVGESGPGSDFTRSSGALVPTSENGRNWVQYRVRLFGDRQTSPLLRILRLNYR